MEKKKTDAIGVAAARAIDAVAQKNGVGAQTVRTEIEQALRMAAAGGNQRMQALEQANGVPLTPEDAVRIVLLRLALLEKDGQN